MSSDKQQTASEATRLSIRRCRAKGDTIKMIAERVGLSEIEVSLILKGKL